MFPQSTLSVLADVRTHSLIAILDAVGSDQQQKKPRTGWPAKYGVFHDSGSRSAGSFLLC